MGLDADLLNGWGGMEFAGEYSLPEGGGNIASRISDEGGWDLTGEVLQQGALQKAIDSGNMAEQGFVRGHGRCSFIRMRK